MAEQNTRFALVAARQSIELVKLNRAVIRRNKRIAWLKRRLELCGQGLMHFTGQVQEGDRRKCDRCLTRHNDLVYTYGFRYCRSCIGMVLLPTQRERERLARGSTVQCWDGSHRTCGDSAECECECHLKRR